ncbi:MAG: putative glutathione S-transferase-like protein [Rhodospirillales bacterium]|nr:putative glutathione S-transferase-like protein [Rhodospirillales bacterium]
MLTVHGRTNSVNVRKLLWLLDELGTPYDQRDAGMEHGVVNTPAYRAMNPNGRIPTISDGDMVLWESNSCLRYLVMKAGERGTALYPADPAARASVDRWLDWQLSTLGPAEKMMFWGVIRTPPDQRDMAAVAKSVTESGACWSIIDDRLSDGRTHIEGEALTLADIALGAYASRWFGVPVGGKIALPHFERWFHTISARPAYARWLGGILT